ncbi:lipopolysaccharide biosynthesis protein [Spirosoma fluminis]
MVHRIVRALAANLFGQGATLLIQLISVPLLLRQWGAVYYGEWLLLATIPAYLSLSDGGVVAALGNDLAISIDQQEREKAARQLSNGLAAVTGLSLVCGTMLLGILWLTPYPHWLGLTTTTTAEAPITLMALCLYVIASVQQELLSSVYRAEGQYASGRIWITTTRLVEFVVMISIVSMQGRGPQVALGFSLIRLVMVGGMWVDCQRRFSWVRQVSGRLVEPATLRHLLMPSASFLVFAVTNALVLQGSVLLIGALLTPVHVVLYTTLRTLSNAVRQFVGLVNFSIWPEFTLALSQQRMQTAIFLHRVALQTAFWLTFTASVVLIIFQKPLLQIWTKGAVQPQTPLFSLLLVSSLTHALWNTSALTLISVNRHKSVALAYLLTSMGAFVVATGLIPDWSLTGLVVSLIGADVIVLGFVLRKSLQLLESERLRTLLWHVFTDFGWLRRLGKIRQMESPLLNMKA